MTGEQLARLKQLYKRAIDEKELSFMFYDTEVLVAYAKYLIEYEETQR